MAGANTDEDHTGHTYNLLAGYHPHTAPRLDQDNPIHQRRHLLWPLPYRYSLSPVQTTSLTHKVAVVACTH